MNNLSSIESNQPICSFLHLGDIHLGYRQYKLMEREKDFYRSLRDICRVGAIEKKVDFVLIAGDLFNVRAISPQTYNEAVFVFSELKKAGIPVIAIEGNHDFKETGNFSSLRGSWFEALAQNELIYFLYPEYKDSEIALKPLIFNQKFLGGGYLDLPIGSKTIRIIGSKWQGFNAGKSLEMFAESIKQIPSPPADFSVFMFHAGGEDYLPVSRGGVSNADFQCLNGVVDYVALGHIHEHYVIKNEAGQDFIFNPGSTEANSMAEIDIKRGGLLVSVNSEKKINYELLTNYKQRKFIKLPDFKANKFPTQLHLNEFILERTKSELLLANELLSNLEDNKPIVQINIIGQADFVRSNEELNNLKQSIEEVGALYCQVKWDLETQVIVTDQKINIQDCRYEIERQILEGIIGNDSSIDASEEFAELMIRTKDSILKGVEDRELLEALEQH